METLLLIAGGMLLSGALVSEFDSSDAGKYRSYGAPLAYLGVMAMRSSGYVAISSTTVFFWAIAVLILLFINWMNVRPQPVPGVLRRYIAGGALVGMMAGVTLGNAAMIVGSAIGALLGCVACRRITAGTGGLIVWRPLVEIGLPAVVTVTLVGLVLNGFIAR